jgi:hypothetical protein
MPAKQRAKAKSVKQDMCERQNDPVANRRSGLYQLASFQVLFAGPSDTQPLLLG